MSDAGTPTGVGVVIVAAGAGTRLGAGVPKAFVEVAGRPLLAYAVERALAVAGWRSLVLVVPAEYVRPGVLERLGVPLAAGMSIVAGGAERSDSVRRGLARVDASCDVVLVHDAARAFAPPAVFDRLDRVITGTPERAALRAVQTPQGFASDVLRAAHASGRDATDDAALVELLGHEVVVVEGDPHAFKVTTPADLALAEELAAAGREGVPS